MRAKKEKRRKGKERKGSLCASLRMKRSTVLCSPVTWTAHTSSSAGCSRRPAPLTLAVTLQSGRRGDHMDKQPTVRYGFMSCQSSEFIGRYRRSTACAMAHADSRCAPSGIAARATAVHAWCLRVPEERVEHAESRLRGCYRRTADQAHRGRCPANLSRPWGRSRSAWVAIN